MKRIVRGEDLDEIVPAAPAPPPAVSETPAISEVDRQATIVPPLQSPLPQEQ